MTDNQQPTQETKVVGQLTLTILETGDVVATPLEVNPKYVPFLAAGLGQLIVNAMQMFITNIYKSKEQEKVSENA